VVEHSKYVYAQGAGITTSDRGLPSACHMVQVSPLFVRVPPAGVGGTGVIPAVGGITETSSRFVPTAVRISMIEIDDVPSFTSTVKMKHL
jgi:hypothetical protein